MRVTIGDYTFGSPLDPLVITSYESTLGGVRTDDSQLPFRHGLYAGRDYLDSGVFTMVIRSNAGIENWFEATYETDRLANAWRKQIDARPGELVPLKIEIEDYTRVVYGRPGRLSHPIPNVLANQGLVEVIAEFRVLDPYFYDYESTSTTISVVPKSLGGIIAPIVTPVRTTIQSGVSYRTISNIGDAPAFASIVFKGTASNPRVTIAGVHIGIKGDLAYDEEITIDGRTRTATYQDGRNAAHMLSRESRPDLLVIPHGIHEISFRADDKTNTAQVTVKLQAAHYSL